MKIGYARVSTMDQKLDRQINALENEGCKKIFTDKKTGANTDRPGLKQLVEYVREGETVVVDSLDRLGRNYNDIKNILYQLKQKKVKVKILDAPLINLNTNDDGLNEALFDMFLAILGYIAQNERKQMLERQKAGIEQAKKNNRYKGKQKVYTADSPDPNKRYIYNQIVKGLENKKGITNLSKELNVSRTLIYRIKNELM